MWEIIAHPVISDKIKLGNVNHVSLHVKIAKHLEISANHVFQATIYLEVLVLHA